MFSADFFAKKRIYAYYSTNNTKKHVEHEREMISGMLLVFVAQNANSFRILIVFSGFWRRAVKRPSRKPHSGYVLWHSYIDKEAIFFEKIQNFNSIRVPQKHPEITDAATVRF